MCDPVSIAALATSAAGTIYSGVEANKNATGMVNARNAATQAELERDKAYGAESRNIFDISQNLFAPGVQADKLATNQATGGQAFGSTVPTNVGSISTTNAPAAVVNGENNRVASVFSRLGDRATARGNLQGYDQTTFNNGIDLGQNARKIDTIGDFAKVSSGVNRAEQDAAYRNAYRPPSGIGDILKAAGTIGAYSAGKGTSLPTINVPGMGFPGGGWGFAS